MATGDVRGEEEVMLPGMLDDPWMQEITADALREMSRLTGENLLDRELRVVRADPSSAPEPPARPRPNANAGNAAAMHPIVTVKTAAAASRRFELPAAPIVTPDPPIEGSLAWLDATATAYDLDSEDEGWIDGYNAGVSTRGGGDEGAALRPETFEQIVALLLRDRGDELSRRCPEAAPHVAAVRAHVAAREVREGGRGTMLPVVERRTVDDCDPDELHRCGYPILMGFDPKAEPMSAYPERDAALAKCTARERHDSEGSTGAAPVPPRRPATPPPKRRVLRAKRHQQRGPRRALRPLNQ